MERHLTNKKKSLKVARETGYMNREETMLTTSNSGEQLLQGDESQIQEGFSTLHPNI
jgi:hypothetical protein